MTNDAASYASSHQPPSQPQPQARRVGKTAASRSARGKRAASAAPEGVSDVVLGQLLCSRLCHDLIGPTAAINAGRELIEEDSSQSEAAHELLADSARQLAGRLTFFRTAFGQGGSRGELNRGEALRLVDGFLLGGRVALDRTTATGDEQDALPGETGRVLLCLIMMAADFLPRGGRLRLSIERPGPAMRIAVVASGRAARVAEETRHALRACDADALTARTVHAFYLAGLARRLGGSVAIDEAAEGEVRIAATLPLSEADLAAVN